MKRTLSILALAAAVNLSGCAQKPAPKTDNDATPHVLVAYFSATGTTKRVAQLIADTKGGILFEIAPERPYTSADLDWTDKQSRSSVDMANPDARPAIADTLTTVEPYDTIYIGYPIWWDEAPREVNTFIERHDLSGKVIIPFATSGGSTIANSVNQLRKTYPNLDWQNGKLLNGATADDVNRW